MVSTRWLVSACLVLALAMIPACRASLAVQQAPQGSAPAIVNGLPFKVRETYTMRVYKVSKKTLADGKNETSFNEVFVKTLPLPNPWRVFGLNVESEAFAAGELKVEYLKDSTLRVVDISETRDLDGAKSTIAGAGTTLESALKIEEAVKAREAELKKAREAERTEEVNAWSEYALLEQARDGLVKAKAAYLSAQDKHYKAQQAIDKFMKENPDESKYTDDQRDALTALLEHREEAKAVVEGQASLVRSSLIAINKSYLNLGRDAPYPNVYAWDPGTVPVK